MLDRTRVVRTPDMSRISAAVSRPGIDPRDWFSRAVIKAYHVDPKLGPYVDVELQPSGDRETAEVGSIYAGNGWGIYARLRVGDQVVVGYPDGGPDSGLVVLQRLWCEPAPPPQSAVDNQEDLVIHVEPGKALRIVTSGDGKVVVQSDDVNLGEDDLGNTQGVVNGEGVDPFTGKTYWLLGNASGVVKAKK